MNTVRKSFFVFGSNLSGRHGLGGASHARLYHDASYRAGKGITGSSYALPTKDEDLNTLKLNTIKKYINEFIKTAKDNPDKIFRVTKVGCGLAGYKESQIKPLFEDVSPNCLLPIGWKSNKESKVTWCRGCMSLVLMDEDVEEGSKFCKTCEDKVHTDKSIPNIMRDFDTQIEQNISKDGADLPKQCSICRTDIGDDTYKSIIDVPFAKLNRHYIIDDLKDPVDCQWVCRDCFLNWHDMNVIILMITKKGEDIYGILDHQIYNTYNFILTKSSEKTDYYLALVDRRGYKIASSGTSPF